MNIYHLALLQTASAFGGAKMNIAHWRNSYRAGSSYSVAVNPFSTSNLLWRAISPEVMQNKRQHSGLQMMDLTTLFPVFLLESSSSGVAMEALNTIPSNPVLEAELLNTLSHVALDMFTFFTPERFILHFANVIGRVLSITSDYIPDHYMTNEEIIFQTGMLVTSTRNLLKISLISFYAALKGPTSFQDRVVYQILFRPLGVSWLQFQKLFSMGVDWVEVKPNMLIAVSEEKDALSQTSAALCCGDEENKYLYWLYEGDTEIHMNGAVVQYIERKHHGKSTCDYDYGLLGDLELSILLEKKTNGTSRKHKNDNRKLDECPKTTIKTGSKGATYLRLEASKLIKLMDEDPSFNSSIRKLLLKGVQRKTYALLAMNAEEMKQDHQDISRAN